MNGFRLIWLGVLFLVSADSFAQQSTSINIDGLQIKNATNQSRSSSPGTISPAFAYEYHISGMARGSGGILQLMFPIAVPLSQMLETLAPGSSVLLNGVGPNPSGGHPVILADQRVDGTQVLNGITVTFGFNIKIEIGATGIVSFSLTNVTLQPSILVGSILVTTGTVSILRAPGIVTGIVDLQDFSGDQTDPSVSFELRNPGSTTPVQTIPMQLFADGRYILITNLRGTYDIACKPSHWLRAISANVVITDSGVIGLDFTNINGDVEPDNEVNIVDFGAFSVAFGSTPGDSNWNANADLDGDLEVTLPDFGILSSRFGLTGDE